MEIYWKLIFVIGKKQNKRPILNLQRFNTNNIINTKKIEELGYESEDLSNNSGSA